jgi:TIR domain
MKLFFSYAHKDEHLRDQLATHISLLKRQNIITDWHDRNITAGTDWAQAIDDNLNTADIILLLISSDFLASDYCYDKEMTRALERHNQNTARVIPIILRPCDWHSAPFGKLQALPKDAKPVTEWDNQDKAFTNIAQGIRTAVAELQQRTSTQPKG